MKKITSIKDAVKNAVEGEEEPKKDAVSHAIGKCGDCGGNVCKKDDGFACCDSCGATHEHDHSLPVLSMKKKS